MPESRLPSLTPQQVVRALKRCGFVELRQKGSHLVLYNQSTRRRVVVPMHKGKDIKKPLLKKIIESEAKLSVRDFLELL
jgi:predicted RNA binding protein YcfA (HicA-like mRNA interferase family)